MIATKRTGNALIDFKLTEFNMATALDQPFNKTNDGTIEWLAPELLTRVLVNTGTDEQTKKTVIKPDKLDVYGVALCLFYMIYGEDPSWIVFKRPELLQCLKDGDCDLFWAIMEKEAPGISVPRDVRRIMFSCL